MSLTKYIVFLIPRCSGSNGWQKCFAFWTIRILARTLRNSFKNAIVHYGLQQTQSSKLPTRHIATNNPIIHTNIETNNQKIYVTTQASKRSNSSARSRLSPKQCLFLRYHVFLQNLNFCQQQSTMEAFSRNKLYLLSTVSINSMSHDSETPRLIANGPVSAQNSLIEDACKFIIFRRFDWRRMSIPDICVFLSTNKRINVNTRYE